MGAGLQAHKRRVRAQQEHPADGARRAAAYAGVKCHTTFEFNMSITDIKNFDLNENLSILIGENGSGKSLMLNDLSDLSISKGHSVISIANCINDKFSSEGKRVKYLGARLGEKMHTKAIKDALSALKTNDKNIPILGKCLNYIGYTEKIGVKINIKTDLDIKNLSTILISGPQGTLSQAETIRMVKRIKKVGDSAWLKLDSTFNLDSINSTLLDIIKYEDELKQMSVLDSIHFFLSQENGVVIDFENISSGQASKIATSFFIAAHINKNTVLLLDEPENSLHPRWQRKYTNFILDLYSLYQPKIIIATHSPLIVSSESKVYILEEKKIKKSFKDAVNIESILWEMFGIISPQSHFLSNLISTTLENYQDDKISKNEVKTILMSIQDSIYDERQANILNEVNFIFKKLEESKSF